MGNENNFELSTPSAEDMSLRRFRAEIDGGAVVRDLARLGAEPEEHWLEFDPVYALPEHIPDDMPEDYR